MSGVPGKVSTGAGISLGADGYSTSSGTFSAGTTPPITGALNIDASGYGGTFLAATNTSGSSITMSLDATTNTMTVNGNVVVTGTVSEAAVSEGPLTITGGTVTVSTPFLQATQSWNAAGVTFTGMKVNVTDTASASGSLLQDFQVGGVSKFSITKAGAVTAASNLSVATGAVYQINGTSVLSATTLGSSVVTSSLTTVGTLSAGAVPASLVTAGTFGAGAYTFPGALAITGALTGVTTLTASSTATIGAATSPLLLDRLADFTNYGAMSFNGSLTSTTMNGFFGRLNAADGGLYITAPSGSATRVQVAGSTVATFAGALTTLATPLAITGAFTGATTGTFSSTGGAYTLLLGSLTPSADAAASIILGSSNVQKNWKIANNTTGPAILEFFPSTAGGNTTFSGNVMALSTAGALTIGAGLTATTGTFSSTLAVTGAATFSSTVSMGALTATSGTFSGEIRTTFNYATIAPTSGTGFATLSMVNTGGTLYYGMDNSTATFFGTGGNYGTAIYRPASTTFAISRTTNVDLLISATGTITAAGVYSTTVGATNRDLYIDNTGLIGYVSSIRAAKTNITPLTDTSWLDALTPVAFNYRKKDEDGAWTDEANTPLEYGLIAEDVEGVNTELVFYDETEDGLALRGVSYSKLMIPLLQRIQTLTARVAALEAH